MSALRKDNSYAYLASLQMDPKTYVPISQNANANKSDNIATLMFSDKEAKRLITVSASGEFSLPPDRVKLTVLIRSLKNTIDEAKQSAARRFEYVQQNLRNTGLKETDIIISKIYNRKDNLYEVLIEISAFFCDFAKYQQLHNLFVEKLDETVKVLPAEFSHTSLRVENLKRQASIQAVRNAKHVAFDLAKTVSLSLGKPLNICEESCREIEGMQSADRQPEPSSVKTFQEIINDKTVTVFVNIRATFELKQKGKNRKEN